MTDAIAATATPRLYSQTPHDDRGNFHYQGDFYISGEPLAALAARIQQHLASHFPDMSFAIRTERFAHGRKVIADILDAPGDLTARAAQENVIVDIRDQVERFGFTRTNPLQDFWSCSFYCDVRVTQAYWAALAKRRGPKNPVASTLTLSAFKKRVVAGDRFRLVDAPAGHRALGTTRTITKVRSNDLILDGQSYLTLPRASAFACDGRLIRISVGSEHDPDAHLLYEWHPAAA